MIKDFLVAIGNYKKYGNLLNNDGFRVTAYVALLLLVCSIGLVIYPVAVMGSRTLNIIWEDIPQFTITDSGMSIDSDFNVDLAGVTILATDERQISNEDLDDSITGVVMDADSVIIRNLDKTAEFTYDEFGQDFSVTKKDLLNLRPFVLLFGVILSIMLYLSNGIMYLLDSVVVGAIASIISVFMGIKMKTTKYIKLGIYSSTLPFIIKSIMNPFNIQVTDFVRFAISICLIILFYRDLVKKAADALKD